MAPPQFPLRYGPPPPLGSKPASSKMFGRNNDLRFSLRLAEITRVDYEGMVCDLQFLQGSSPPAEEVPISSAYWSKRGFLGAMPEVGSIAIVGYTAVQQDEATRPLILAFMPNGFKTALNFDPIGSAPRGADEMTLPKDQAYAALDGLYGATRRKFRKIYPGTIYATSDRGSEIIMNEGIHLFDQGGSEILMRSEDGAGIFTFQDLYTTVSGIRKNQGRVVRNALSLPTDFLQGSDRVAKSHPLFQDLVRAKLIRGDDGTLLGDVTDTDITKNIILPGGRRQFFVVENGESPLGLESRFFVENRTEIQEFSDPLLPLSPAHGADIDKLITGEEAHRPPFIEKAAGTVIGNDPYTEGGRPLYGQILRPAIFNDPNATEGQARLEALGNNELEGERNLAAAYLYRMRRPDGLGDLFLAHDKEGHVYLSIPASSSHVNNLGGGRSVEADIKGAVKAVLGADQGDHTSLDLHAKGGLKWSLGKSSRAGRSLDLQAAGGVAFEVQGPDGRGDAFRFIAEGNIGVAAEGSYGISVSEGHIEEVGGQKSVSAEALATSVGSGNYTLAVLSDHDTNVAGRRTATLGEGEGRVIYTGGEDTKVMLGSSSLAFLAPASREISFLAAGEHTIRAGGALTINRQAGATANYSFTAPSGSYSISLAAGSVNLLAGLGNVNISPAGVQITGPSISLAGAVSLGTAAAPFAVVGGVPGPSPHLDYITGMPLTGNPLVRTM